MGFSFDEFAESVMDEVLSWDPAYATQVGWHKYDNVLRDLSREALERQTRRCSELIQTLSDIPDDELDLDQRLDRDLAIHIVKLKLFETQTLRLFEKESVACGEIGYSLFFLFARDHPSLERRIQSIIHRLEAVPKLLSESKKVLHAPLRVWNEAAHETGSEMPGLLLEILRFAETHLQDHSTIIRIQSAVVAATKAIEEHNRWIREEILPNATEECAITPEEYARYIELKGYGVTMDEALEIGETYLRIARRRMVDVARQIVGSGDPREALESMKANHPDSFDDVLEAYRKAVHEAREVLVRKDMVTIPEGENLLIVETPHFMRPMTPFAAQYEPGKFDGSRTGMFMVTPDDGNPSMLREHSYASIVNTAVHEGYPGHHLQGICSNTNPSYIRILIASPDFSEGWGLYSEDLMISQGFNDDPMGKLANINDLLFRIARLVIEVKLVKGEMTIEEGAKLFVEECHMEEHAARLEARSCAMSPTYFSSYFLGKLGIMQLMDDVKEAMGDKFSLKFFHDSLLYSGCLPMGFMRRAMAIRLKEAHGIVLGEQKESLYKYAMRKAMSEDA